ncbi:Transmembrane domain-containing protein [Spironucleus salmonicida]|nr:Transmembrane domain-containing protein [Spironucleus salmonicida]
MLVGVLLISIGCRLLFSFSSQNFPDKQFQDQNSLSIQYLLQNNLSLIQGIQHQYRKFFASHQILQFLWYSLLESLISLTLYLQLIKLSKFIPPNRYNFFQILTVLVVCMTTSNNLFIYYVPNIISHFEILNFMLYIDALVHQNVFLSNILFFLLSTSNQQFLSLVFPQSIICYQWVFQHPLKRQMVFTRIFLTLMTIVSISFIEYLFYQQNDFSNMFQHIYPNILLLLQDSEQQQCILQPNTYVLLRSVIQIIKFGYKNLYLPFPVVVKQYYSNHYNFVFWQCITFILFQIPILVILVKNKDVYNKEQQQTLTPLFYVVISLLSFYFSFYEANQSILLLIFYVFVILYFHQKINISLNYSQIKINKKPLIKIKPHSNRKKLCIKTENDHIKSPSSLFLSEFDDIYSQCKQYEVVQAVNKQQLNKLNNLVQHSYKQYDELTFEQDSNKMGKYCQQMKLRLKNYIDTISIQSIGLCLQLSCLVATFQITYDLLNNSTTIFIKFGMEIVWKTLLIQSDQLFTKLVFNHKIILIQMTEELLAQYFIKDYHNLVGYTLQSINFGVLLFIYMCCLLTLVSRSKKD